ncbi:membrane-flanked domain protein [Haloterrigena turkmenica DSM 5511]|uniref:Membrane-flanked domain protein n=1 Tax=Haloterrigena turkmenica (strain ATCC 51198 / DSM 5511 / JCM 9101 / NCIMB 13204 / VKM B-1734 / 4k) TaxID=543526 RepID=D2RSC4_HALTV|nr:PH domain-containing protein [Haloterrigena turkmenica]ADB60705.1 membrane-flanked domain protein [Haloterrigena turkmenica DSM 5511]
MNRLHPLSAAAYALQYGFLWLSAATILTLVLGGIFGPIDSAWVPIAAPVGLVAGAAYGIAYFYRFEYGITPDTFDVSSGVFARRSREIPYERIQNVDVRQGVVQRLLGLAVVSIETAGGGSTEAALNFVSESEATRLQHQIRTRTADVRDRRHERGRRDASATTDERTIDEASSDTETERTNATTDLDEPVPDAGESAAEPDSTDGTTTSDSGPVSDSRDRVAGPDSRGPRRQHLFALEARELLLYSFTSFRPAAAAALLGLFFFATDLAISLLVSAARPFGGPANLGEGSPTSYGILTVVSVVNGVVTAYVLSVVYTFAAYYDFRLGRAGGDFVYERGLLQRYSGSIPVEKVQSVTVSANPLQRLLGYAGLWVETAGYGPDSDSGGSQSAVPLAERGRVHRFTETLTGVESPRFRSPPTTALRRYLVRYAIVATVVVAAAFAVTRVTVLERWYVAAVVFVAVPPAAYLKYVHLGYYVGEDHLVVRRGFWKQRTTVIPYYRIQTVSTRRSIFQRRLGLASLVVDTASSRSFSRASPTIYDVNLEDARDVHGTGRKRLQTALRERARADDGGPGLTVDFT